MPKKFKIIMDAFTFRTLVFDILLLDAQTIPFKFVHL